MSLIDDALSANATLSDGYDSSRGAPPKPQIAVVTCADPRLSGIVQLLGLTDSPAPSRRSRGEVDALADVAPEEIERMIVEREQEMFIAAEELRFELAARLRDEIADLRRELLERAAPAGDGDEGESAPPPARRPNAAPVPRKSARRAARGGRRR